jgi:transcriptional regulator with XRE-family HTH domain
MRDKKDAPASVDSGPLLDEGFRIRLADVVERVGGVAKAGKVAGVQRNQISRWQKLEQRPPLEAMIKLARAADTNLQWLATGEGPKESRGKLLHAAVPAAELLSVPRVALDLASSLPPTLRLTGDTSVLSVEFAHQVQNRDPTTLVVADAVGVGMTPAVAEHAELFIDTAQREVRTQGDLFVFVQDDRVFIRWLQRDPAGILIGEPGKTSASRLLTVPIVILGRVVLQLERTIYT